MAEKKISKLGGAAAITLILAATMGRGLAQAPPAASTPAAGEQQNTGDPLTKNGDKPAGELMAGSAPKADVVQASSPGSTPIAEPDFKPQDEAGAPRAGFRIGPGDVLQINVWKEPEASVPVVVVRSDGKISLPLIKELDAVGLTPSELERLVTEKLTRFINAPEVAVLVREINSEKVYLVGGVKKEGSVRLHSSMTVLQVLSEGGGLTEYAKRKKIYVLRTENRKQIRLPFNYDEVVRGEQIEQNFFVQPGDTIIVPQ